MKLIHAQFVEVTQSDKLQEQQLDQMNTNLEKVYVTRQHTFQHRLVQAFITKVEEIEQLKQEIDLLKVDSALLDEYQHRFEAVTKENGVIQDDLIVQEISYDQKIKKL